MGDAAFTTTVQLDLEMGEALTAFPDAAMSSDEDELPGAWGGARTGKALNKERDFAAAHTRVVNDYFNGRDSVYSEADFERRFRMPRALFNRIHERIVGQDPFVEKEDPTGKLGVRPLVKLVACLLVCFLSCGGAHDREDKTPRIGQSALNAFVRQFCSFMIKEFGPEFLNRHPTPAEKASTSSVMAKKGFPGCLLPWDCKHFNWEKCPVWWAGQHQGHAEGGRRKECPHTGSNV